MISVADGAAPFHWFLDIMKTLKNSFEIKEAARIFGELVADAAVIAPEKADSQWPKIVLATPVAVSADADNLDDQAMAATTFSQEESPAQVVYRSDQLHDSLVAMCKRGGFNGAVVADNNGFPLAAYNSPVDDDVIAAFTSVLGMALEQAGQLLDEHEANHIIMNINYTEKAALRQFFIDDAPYFLMIICPQEVDEKSEIELSIDRVTAILR